MGVEQVNKTHSSHLAIVQQHVHGCHSSRDLRHWPSLHSICLLPRLNYLWQDSTSEYGLSMKKLSNLARTRHHSRPFEDLVAVSN